MNPKNCNGRRRSVFPCVRLTTAAGDGPWTRVGVNVAVVVAVVWTSLRACCDAALDCQFPQFLQTNSSSVDGHTRDWRGRVREQHTETGLRMIVSGGKIIVDSADDKTTSYALNCVQMVSTETKTDSFKFLVRRTDNGSLPYYTCVEFVQRSPQVVQLRTTPLSDREPDMSICDVSVDMWQLDPWLIVDRAGVPRSAGTHRAVPCALRGGFSVRMYDRAGHQGACDSRQGETRMEADCQRLADGTHFYFRHASCIPVGLYMYATQRTVCAANWAVGAYTFTLLTHDRLSYAWLLRFPTKPEDSFTAYLFADLVADPAEYITETSNYIRLDTVRDVPRPATSLCLDEHDDACAVWRRPCTSGPQTALTCPRTCGVCNATRPIICSFPPELIGVWNDGSNNLEVEFQQTSLTMSPTYSSRLSTLRCVSWRSLAAAAESDRFRYVSDDMLVAEYSDGCRPRYVCSRILRKSSSVMYFRLSDAETWPLTSSVDEPIDCHAFSFDHPGDDVADRRDEVDAVRATQINRFRLLFSRESRGDATSCRLPSHELNNYSVTFRDGAECLANVVEELSGTSLRLSLGTCSPPVNRTHYLFQCRETSLLPPSNDLVVIVSSTPTRNRTAYHCWLFPRRAVWVFYLFDADQCDLVMRGYQPAVQSAADQLPAADQLLVDDLTSLAVFSSKSRRTPREEDVDPDTIANPASRVHLAPMDGRRRVAVALGNTSVPTPSSSSSSLPAAQTSPSVLATDAASVRSYPITIAIVACILTVVVQISCVCR